MSTETVTLQGRSVLVCDVDESILDLLTDVFREEGAVVTQALGGQAAIDAIKTGQFDLILQGLVLPDVDGWDVLTFARARRPDLANRFVLMTGYTYDPHTVRRIERQHLPALFKPFDLDQLHDVTHQTLYAAQHTPKRSAA